MSKDERAELADECKRLAETYAGACVYAVANSGSDVEPAGAHSALHAAIDRLAAAPSQASVPAGWKLVPVEPTSDMVAAARVNRAYSSCTDGQVWSAMLAAAPQAPAPEAPKDEPQAPESAHPDDYAVDRFAVGMKAKLAAARAKGRSGWDDPAQCTVEHLSDLLRGHVGKGDPVDVANFAMMLQQRGSGITPEAPKDEPVAWGGIDCTGRLKQCEMRRYDIEHDGLTPVPLYTTPQPKRVPLTDEQDRIDAERYRWLRAQTWDVAPLCVVFDPKRAVRLGYDCPSADRLDAAIDAARGITGEAE